MCKPGFNSGDLGEEFCYRPNCFIHHDERMQKGCVPVYHRDNCCPWEWICPKAGGGVTDNPEEAAVETEETHGVPDDLDNDDDNDGVPDAEGASSGDVVRVPCPPGSEPIEDFPYSPMVTPTIGILAPEDSPPEELPDYARVDKPPKSGADCLLPRALGPCSGFEDRFFFNSDSRRCEPFKFGGYNEAGNVFQSLEQCEGVCESYMLPDDDEDDGIGGDEGCAASEDSRVMSASYDRCMPRNRFRFNRETQRCEDFGFMGCRKNADSYRTVEEYEARCGEMRPARVGGGGGGGGGGAHEECDLPAARGMCYARLRRFFYDAGSGICKQFFFGGCRGNANNFLTESDCIEKCVRADALPRALAGFNEDVRSPCDQEKVVGLCR